MGGGCAVVKGCFGYDDGVKQTVSLVVVVSPWNRRIQSNKQSCYFCNRMFGTFCMGCGFQVEFPSLEIN